MDWDQHAVITWDQPGSTWDQIRIDLESAMIDIGTRIHLSGTRSLRYEITQLATLFSSMYLMKTVLRGMTT